jgi:hypothetical protein
MIEHATLLSEWCGEGPALRALRRHASWYTYGFRGSARARSRFMQVCTLSELREVIGTMNPEEPFPPGAMRVPRGKTSGTQVVSLPPGYLDDRNDLTPPEDDGHIEGG